jgi:ketosteroid isomerase-like protein
VTQEEGTSDERSKLELLEQMAAAFNRHDLDTIMSLFADDCVFESPRGSAAWGTRFVGKAEVREGLAGRFRGLPDVHYGNARHFVAGERGASEWTLTGTTPQGERIEVRGCDLWTFEGDRVVVKDSYWKIVTT